MESVPARPQLLAAGSMLLPAHYLLRDPNVRSDREHLSELEQKLVEARQRFQDLKEKKLCGGNSLKVCGCGCCPHSYVRAREHKPTNMFTGSDSRSVAETSRKIVGNQSIRQQQPRPETIGADHSSPSSEGLLLAVDKFLSAKDALGADPPAHSLKFS